MRLASVIVVGSILLGGPLSGAAAQSAAEGKAPRAEWYVGGGLGSHLGSRHGPGGLESGPALLSDGRVFRCGPCSRDLRLPLAVRRHRADVGAAFELSAGRLFDRTRLEFSFAQRKNGLDQRFRSITDYDGLPMDARRGSTVVSNTQASIDHLTVRTLSLNAYYDFPKAYRGMTPYLGGGLGPAFVTVAGVHFSNEYEDTAGTVPADYHPVSIYNSRQDDDLSDTVLAGHLYAGADYHLHDMTVLGLKLTYSMLGTIEASSGYARHPLHARDPDFSNHNTFTGSRDWTLAVTVKFLLGN